jgi:hypothetical protein
MKKVLRLIVVVLTLISFSAAFADIGGTTKPGGNRAQILSIEPAGITLGDDLTLLSPWQIF